MHQLFIDQNINFEVAEAPAGSERSSAIRGVAVRNPQSSGLRQPRVRRLRDSSPVDTHREAVLIWLKRCLHRRLSEPSAD
jgi:hypothetical protein